jgi:tetratricopeptide (TPR) repeat protein
MDKLMKKALEIAQQALTLHRELGDRYEECMALNGTGIILAWMGRFDEAQEFIRQSLEIAMAIESNMGLWIAYANLQWIYYRREGKLEDGLNLRWRNACPARSG